MKAARVVRGVALTLATLGICLPQVTAASTPAILDFALADGGVLHGQVVNTQDLAPRAPVYIRTPTRPSDRYHMDCTCRARSQGRCISSLDAPGTRHLSAVVAGNGPPVAQNRAVIHTQNAWGRHDGPLHAKCCGDNCCGGNGPLVMLLSNPIVIARPGGDRRGLPSP